MLKRLLNRGVALLRNDVTLIASSTALAHGLTACAAPVLSRIYGAQAFGALQIYMSVLGLFVAVTCCRYEVAILIARDDQEAADLVTLSIAAAALISTAAFALLSLLPDSTTAFSTRFVVPFALFVNGLVITLTHWSLRNRVFKDIARTKVTQSVTMAGVQLSLGVTSLAGQGLAIGDALSRCAAATYLVGRCAARGLRLTVQPERVWSAALRHRAFALLSTPSMMLNSAGMFLPPLFFARLYGTECLGLYALVDRMLAVPSALIGSATAQVYMSRMSALLGSDAKPLRRLYLSTTGTLCAMSVVPALVVFAYGPSIFAFAFGEPWREAGVYARILVASSALGFIAWPATPTMSMLGAQSSQLCWDGMRMVATVSAVYLAYEFGVPARGALLSLSAIMTGTYVVQLWLAWLAVNRFSRASPVLKTGSLQATVRA